VGQRATSTDRAIADCNEAIRLDPKDDKAYYNRGVAWGLKGDLDRAIAEYNEAIRLNPKYALAFGPRHCMGDQARSWRGIG
jgi:tetratricopeptide (TPR) repeat protein